MKKLLWLLPVMVFFVQCKTNGHIPTSSEKGIPNETNEYFLHIKNEEDGRLTFYVTAKGSDEKLVEKNIMPGYVKWSGIYEIEYFHAPEIVPEDYDMTKDIKKISIKSINPQK
jgi:hypothetical protein